jgi:hypothetical protein
MFKFKEGEIILKESTCKPSIERLIVLEEAETFIFYLQGYSCEKVYQKFGETTYGILPCGDRILSCICEDNTLHYIDEEPVFYA